MDELDPTEPTPRLLPRIVVLSERALFRDCLVEYLRHGGFAETTGCPRWAALDDSPDEPGPDLLLLDVGQAHEDPADELRRLRSRWPRTIAVAIGTPIQLAAQAGDADGWIDVDEAGLRLTTMAAAATSANRQAPFELEPSREVRRQIDVWRALTSRQRQVLALVGCGLENGQIAAALGIAERTVKLHVTALLVRFAATNRVRLALIAAAAGLRPRDAAATRAASAA